MGILNKTAWFFTAALAASVCWAGSSDLRGSIQIQSSKALMGGFGNVDQVFGRANMLWSFEEDSTFSSLIHARAYPAGFHHEPMQGAGWVTDSSLSWPIPVIVNQEPTSSGNPTWHIYEAWIRYKFTDFDIRIGRMITHETKSLHFGNYLDLPNGGSFTLGRIGVHNSLEFFKVYGMFHTRVHLGLGDTKGDRGYLRFHETITPLQNLKIGLGYKINIFDLVNFSPDEDEAQLKNIITAHVDYQLNPLIGVYGEGSWSHVKGDADERDPIPVTAGFSLSTQTILKELEVPPVLDELRMEMEYLNDRHLKRGPYNGLEKDFLWNIYLSKVWLKRMHFEGGMFAAPNSRDLDDIGVGLRFTSSIN